MSHAEPRFREQPGVHPSVAAVWSVGVGDEIRSIIPADGCFDVIVRVPRDGRAHAFIYEPRNRADGAVVAAGTRVFGVRLKPGYGAAIRENSETLRGAGRWAAMGGEVIGLEAIIASAIETFGDPPNAIREFVGLAVERCGAVRLTADSSTAGERELQRAARRWLGLAPKAFLRIERVHAARKAIRQGLPLAAVAADFGYADQAHLTREVRTLLGVTPRQLRPVGILQDLTSRKP